MFNATRHGVLGMLMCTACAPLGSAAHAYHAIMALVHLNEHRLSDRADRGGSNRLPASIVLMRERVQPDLEMPGGRASGRMRQDQSGQETRQRARRAKVLYNWAEDYSTGPDTQRPITMNRLTSCFGMSGCW